MDGRADAAEVATAKTIHEKLMDKEKFLVEFQQTVIDYIKEVESEVERLGVGITGCNFSKRCLEFRVDELNSTKQWLDLITNHLNATREEIATHHDYYVPPTEEEEEEEEDSSSTCSKQH